MSKVPRKPNTPQYRPFQGLKLALPKHGELYKLRRVYWLLNNYHKLLEKNPAAVSSKQYLELLDVYCSLVDNAKKRGWDSAEGRKHARAGVDTKGVAKDGRQDSKTGVGETLPPGLGLGV